MQITVDNEETVMAAESVPPYELLLSDNDNVMPRVYTAMWFIFENNNVTDHGFMSADKLNSALSDTLVSYYECAGRLKNLENGGLSITCDNSGVLWETATGDFSLKDLRDMKFEQASLPDGLVNQQPADGELLTVRVTNLTDHSVILGIGMHHALADATGTFNFIRSWAEIARGKEVEPDWATAGRLLGDSKSSPKSEHPEYAVMQEGATYPTLPPLTAVTFLFNREALDSAKTEATKQAAHLADPPRFLSTNDALCGLLLRCVTRAENVVTADIKLGMAVNGRSRLEPNLPDTYFGNVNFFALAPVSTEQLFAENGLGYAAAAVRKSVDHITNEHIIDALNWVAAQHNKAKIIPGFNCFFGNDFAVTSWVNGPAYEMDFGWGTPVRFGIPAKAFKGLAIIMPAPPGTGAALAVTLGATVDALNRLKCDQEFMRYVLAQ